jgi:hypothetical protein
MLNKKNPIIISEDIIMGFFYVSKIVEPNLLLYYYSIIIWMLYFPISNADLRANLAIS